MKLIVLLGNPGAKYADNRHNVGWQFGDFFQQKEDFEAFREEKKFFGAIANSTISEEKVLLLKPLTFMNHSGAAVLAVKHFYKLELADIIVIFDDKDLPFGQVRFRLHGGSGGHNGIKDIITHLGSEEFSRIKIGVDNPLRQEFDQDTAAFVLSDFSKTQKQQLPTEIFPLVVEKLVDWFSQKTSLPSDADSLR